MNCPKCKRKNSYYTEVCKCGYRLSEPQNTNTKSDNDKLMQVIKLLLFFTAVTVISASLITITNGNIIVIGVLILSIVCTVFFLVKYFKYTSKLKKIKAKSEK